MKWTNRNQQERIGVSTVSLIISKIGYIFRETLNSDIGIDGTIEFVNDADEATGKLLQFK